MGLTNKKEEQFRRMPIIQNRIGKSKNGRYIIQRTIITSIKPVQYYETILKNAQKAEDDLDKELEEYLMMEGESVLS
ncbi:MAG: hypothetical protein V1725_01505 [archaeon]